MTVTTSAAGREAPRTTKRQTLPALTGMRFIAALAVFLFHLTLLSVHTPHGVDILHQFADAGVRDAYNSVFHIAGFTGVSFFFALSGFVLTWSARPTDTLTGFWRRRFFKIYPLHVVTYAAGLLLLTGGAFAAGNDLPGVVLIQSWIPDASIIFAANSPSWSISVEALFYLLFPLLLPLLERIPARRLWGWAAGMVAITFAVAVIAHLYVSMEYQFWFSYTLPPLRLPEFVLGIIAARLVILGRWPNIRLAPAALLLVLAYALALQLPQVFAQTAVTIVPVVLVVGAGAMSDIEGRSKLLRSRTMVWLGEISFAFYMVHLVVLLTVRKWLGVENSWSTPTALLVIAGCLAVTLLLAWLLHIGVERPAMRHWSVRRERRPRRNVPAA
ncbi:acyltransferase [Streptomyces sp. NBC_01142]|uniref:acyltransferase family protein n=1 Tax=Streptomyces sp. NBC_01142 TaxID=2975865 RepID=UPI00225910E8|nr:acyltransferase [Streptomyces sp. NBC_01142]MCX4824984.1 acyltransferase [Streptomyces sp. NBC_01142]